MTQMPDLPEWLRGEQSDGTFDKLDGILPVSSPPYISIEGNRFTMVDATGAMHPHNQLTLGVCVIDTGDHTSKIYYGHQYTPGQQEAAPPDCWSDNGVAPSRNASTPQHAVCMSCPHNMWGTAPTRADGSGGKGKACRDYIKMACLVPGYDFPFLLRIPPNSLQNLKAYREVFRGRGVNLNMVMTELSFQQGVQGTLMFKALSYADQHITGLRKHLLEMKKTDQLVGRGDVPIQGALPAPAAQESMQAFAPAPLPPAVESGPFGSPTTQPSAPTFQPSPGNTPQPVGLTPSSSATESRPKRVRRTQAQIAADNAAAGQPAQSTTAPFAQPGNSGAQFGIETPSAPDPAVANALNGLFGPAQ